MNEENKMEYVITAAVRAGGSWLRTSISGTSKRMICNEMIARIRQILAKANEEPTVLELHWGAVRADDKRIGSYFICGKR